MRMNSRSVVISLVALVAWIAWPSAASAQVVIDMPPPPKKKVYAPPTLPPGDAASDPYSATVKTSSSTTSVSAMYPVSVDQYDVGDVALARYSGARYGTYDTYYNDGSYFSNGMRVYSYPQYFPQYVWGPWWGWGWGWPGFNFGFHCH